MHSEGSGYDCMIRDLWEKAVLWYLALLYRFWPASPHLPEYRVALNLARKYGCRTVLDVGCGRGNLGKLLIKHGIARRYLGIDIVKLFNVEDPRAVFVNADARDEACVMGRFDCVFFVNSLFYIGFSHLFKYAELGDVVIVIDINPSSKYLANKLVDILEGGIRLNPVVVKRELERAGFRILEEKIGAQYYLVVGGGRHKTTHLNW